MQIINHVHFIPQVFMVYIREKKIPKPIVLIGDNLACHFSERVIDICNADDIR